MRIASEIDPLFVRQVERYLALIDSDQDHDDLFTHQPGGVDLRFAPARREPFRRDERKYNLTPLSSFLYGVLPALAVYDASLSVKIEEDIIPAVRGKPVANLDSLVVIRTRMTDEEARHDT